MRKVCVVLVDRANYGRLAPVMEAIQAHPALELQVVCGGTMPLNRFKRPSNVVRAAGFPVDAELFAEVEGNSPGTMARSVGLHIGEFVGAFDRLEPDLVLLIGDRYEMLAAGIAAAYTNRCAVHVQGGEISGSIDESARHCLSKLAQYHVPATEQAAANIIRMGERPDTVLEVGCPSCDLAARITPVDVRPRYVLAVFHPNTTEHDKAAEQMEELLSALGSFYARLFWPNIDSGSDAISKTIRQFRDRVSPTWTYLTNVEPEAYFQLLADAAVCVGNSSSFVRDAGFFGTPVVLVGSRQEGRECAENVIQVPCERAIINTTTRWQIEHGRYKPSDLYGSPGVSERIAEKLATLEPYIQKRLSYAELEAVA
mgnify:CR=1 FL=1